MKIKPQTSRMKQQQHDAFVGSKHCISVIIMSTGLINIALPCKNIVNISNVNIDYILVMF